MLLLTILSIALLNIIYLIGFFSVSILLKVTETHYFLGYNPKLVRFPIRNVTFNIGFYIPIVGLSPIYALTDGEQRMKYPWEFNQHSLIRRFIATFGGALGLLSAGVLIFIVQAYFTTESFITKEEVNKHCIYPSEWAVESGFLTGDKIIAINGKDYREYNELINPHILLAPETSYTVVRDGKQLQVRIKDIPEDFINSGELFLSLHAPFEIAQVTPGSPADVAGIKPGDRITKVNGQTVVKFTEMTNAFQADDDGRVVLHLERKANDGIKVFTKDVLLDFKKRIGIQSKELIHFTERKNSLWQAIQKSTSYTFRLIKSNAIMSWRLFFGTSTAQRKGTGPTRIAGVFERSFWGVTASSAVGYAFYNIFPLPKSAFWEFIPLAYEGVTKKKYPYAAFRKSLTISWIVIGAIFLWVFVNDIIKLL
jgi:regulator of sigma E protease